MGCRKLTYYPETELKAVNAKKELTTKISSQRLRSSYLFGFNGKEKDDELKGEGNSLDFGGRIYDSRLGRWLSLDPLMAKYPNLSPYNFCANNPIINVDPDGEKIEIAIKVGGTVDKPVFQKLQYKNGKLYDDKGKEYKGNNDYANKVLKNLNQLKKDDPLLADRMKTLEESDNTHTIMKPGLTKANPHQAWNHAIEDNTENASNGIGTGTTVGYDPDCAVNKLGDERDPRASLAHELLGHSFDMDQGIRDNNKTFNGISMEEVKAVVIENIVRRVTKTKDRTTYGKKEIPAELLKKRPKK